MKEGQKVCREQLVAGVQGDREVGWLVGRRTDGKQGKGLKRRSFGTIYLPPPSEVNLVLTLLRGLGVIIARSSRLGDRESKVKTWVGLLIGSGKSRTWQRYRYNKQGTWTIVILPL